MNTPPMLPIGHWIKEIGRGQKGARSLSREDARQLYAALLAGRVSDLETGAVLLALRIKGESVDELAGFLDAAHAAFAPLPAPPGAAMPVVLPSYNGARKLPNLTALLALLIAREGVPVLVHGVRAEPGRVTTAAVFAALGLPVATDAAGVADAFAAGQPVWMPVDALAPPLARLLALRAVLGVRNSTHSVVKLLQPFAGPALRLVSYTHPEYLALLTAYFAGPAPEGQGDVFLMRGTEGETVAHPHRAQRIDCFRDHARTVLVERDAPTDTVAALPAAAVATTTADWIGQALRGTVPVPAPIAAQAAACVRAARGIHG